MLKGRSLWTLALGRASTDFHVGDVLSLNYNPREMNSLVALGHTITGFHVDDVISLNCNPQQTTNLVDL